MDGGDDVGDEGGAFVDFDGDGQVFDGAKLCRGRGLLAGGDEERAEADGEEGADVCWFHGFCGDGWWLVKSSTSGEG